MKHVVVSVVCLPLLFALGHPAAAQDSASVVGTWKVKDFSSVEVESKKTLRPFGEKPSGYYIFTDDGTFIAVVYNSERKAPAGAAPTDAERVELFRSMAVTTGRYAVAGTKVTIDIDGSLVQSPVGTKQVREAKIAGNTMEFVSPQISAPQTGQQIVFTVTLERAKK